MTIRAANGRPLRRAELHEHIDGRWVRHGPDGLYGWGPEDTGIHLTYKCSAYDHAGCGGIVHENHVGKRVHRPCTCDCHPRSDDA